MPSVEFAGGHQVGSARLQPARVPGCPFPRLSGSGRKLSALPRTLPLGSGFVVRRRRHHFHGLRSETVADETMFLAANCRKSLKSLVDSAAGRPLVPHADSEHAGVGRE